MSVCLSVLTLLNCKSYVVYYLEDVIEMILVTILIILILKKIIAVCKFLVLNFQIERESLK